MSALPSYVVNLLMAAKSAVAEKRAENDCAPVSLGHLRLEEAFEQFEAQMPVVNGVLQEAGK